ncbi:MAG: ABC transporter ATP-binding protein [Bacilli bacterium]|nr:ABC transporter ATP-binding protein [Bacilli bacterium]
MSDLKHFKLMLKYLKDDVLQIILYVIFSILLNVLPLLTSIFWAYVVDNLTTNQQTNFIIFLALFSLSNILSWAICSTIQDLLYNKLEKDFIKNGQIDLYNKILDLPAIAFEDMGVGELTNRLNNDLEKIISLLKGIIDLSSRFIMAVVILIYSFYVSIFVGLEFIILGVIMYILANIYYPKIKKAQEEISKESDKLSKNATEDINGIREIKALGIKDNASFRMLKIIENINYKQRKIANDENIYYGINNFVYFAIEFIIFLTLGLLVFKGDIDIKLFLVIQTLIWRFDGVIENLSNFGINYNKVVVSLKRIDELVNNRLYKDEKFGTKEINDDKIKIVFDDVKFKYRKDEDYILNGLTMQLLPNKKIAIVGKSGQGKSTIFNLLMRYFDTSLGKIKINDIDIKNLTEDNLRKNISIIRQNPYLFNQSIMENFKMVKNDATLEEVRDVCKKAYIDDYIMSLPKKYNTVIGEGGVNLSGGQKQRIAIARTLLKNAKVILFDEATSALDNESQEYIKKTIDNLVGTHTVIIVAHRLSTIMDSDIIYLIDNGKVLARGNHKELLKTSSLYRRLYNPEMSSLDNDLFTF